jgi:hypothetical protein
MLPKGNTLLPKFKGEIMSYTKTIEHKYQPGDVVYVVNRYMVEKVVIESISIKITEKKTLTNYNVYNYREKDKADKKVLAVGQAYLVDDLLTAISSAKINNDQTHKSVKEALDQISDVVFESMEEKKDE